MPAPISRRSSSGSVSSEVIVSRTARARSLVSRAVGSDGDRGDAGHPADELGDITPHLAETKFAACPIADRAAQLRDGAGCHDPTVLDERQSIAQRFSLRHRVGGEDDRAPELSDHDLSDEATESQRRDRIERAGRLVHEHDRGLVEQASRDRQGLALAGRQHPEWSIDVLGHAQTRGEAVDGDRRGSPVEVAQCREELEVLAARQAPIEGPLIAVDEAHPAADRERVAGDVDAVDAGSSRCGQQQGRQHPHERRLAGPVLPEQAEHLPLWDR